MNLRFVFSLIVSLLSLLPAAAQDLTRNWIRERIFLDAEGKECVTSAQYFDGIGRETLLLTDGLSPGGDVAGALTGESFAGRTSAKWLPATGLTGFDFLTPERVKSLAVSSHEGDSVPFSLTRRDALGRVSSVRNAGGDLAGKAQLSDYTVNRTSAPVKRYWVDASGKLASRGMWREGALRGVLTSDEDGISTEVFSDLRGRKVLERRNGNNDTYFVYDDAGRLSFVLTPGMQEDSNLLKHAYEYRYDRRSECVYSRIPGCEPVEMHRDTAGRTAVVRDGVLRKKGRSRFILYDRFGRTTVQGTCNGFPDAPKHAAAEAAPDISNGFENTGYSFKGISFSGVKIEQVFYYDDYLFLLSPAVAECRESGFLNVSSPNPAKGLQTGSITAVSGGGFVYNALYYTPEGRLSVSKTVYPSGEKLSERTEYTFTGSPRHRVFALSHGGLTDSVSVFYGYGSNGALVSKDLLVNGHDSRRVASLSYDALGRVVGNTLPGKAGRIAYSYNIRNLVTEVAGKGYKGITAYTPGRFNGSPSSATDIYSPAPQTGASGTDTTRWRYSYDALGRLTEAEAVSGDRKHTETTAFDANGNITRLVRWADYAPMLNTAADVLYYTLDGNRPLSISDRGVNLAYAGSFDFKNRGRSGEYAYDGNGRLVSDPYKGMTVTYADWGTPEKMTFDDGNHTAFTYTASGFQSYKYCGKYLDRKHGLDLYDYGARLYDPAAAFWTSPDPLCEKYYNISPYAFCNDNPVTFIDPDGRFIDTAWDAANVAMGVTSFVANVTAGNIVGAALDGAGLIVDVAATAIPVIPGGAATAIKAVRGTKIAEKVVKNAAVKSAVRKGVKKIAANFKPYAHHRPKYAKGQVEEVWRRAMDKDGIVKDPYTNEILVWDGKSPRNWDMGHVRGKEYKDLHKRYMDGKISKEEFLREYRNPDNYIPQSRYSNRSHKFEAP